VFSFQIIDYKPFINIMTLNDIIQNRRSIFPKSYDQNRDIPTELILQILENANAAPSHKLTEPFRAVILRGPSRQALADFLLADYLENTPIEAQSEMKIKKFQENPLLSNVIIALKMKRHPDLVPEWEEIAAVAMAVQNMWLTCASLGIGAYWGSAPAMVIRGGNFLKLEPDEQCLGLLYMGYPKSDVPFPAPKRTPIADKITWWN
jgi:nitroreductase